MALETLNPNLGQGGAGIPSLGKVLKELQGHSVDVVAGAAAGTKMPLAAIRSKDTILSVVVSTNAGGALTADTANVSIASTKANGTITLSGDPLANETFVVNGVTYTWKAVPTSRTHVKITTGNNTAMAAAVRDAINAYENRYTGKATTPSVVATAALGVVTVTANVEGVAGNAITFTESVTNLAMSGSGTLINGTATGGIVSTTNLTGMSLIVYWYSK